VRHVEFVLHPVKYKMKSPNTYKRNFAPKTRSSSEKRKIMMREVML